MNLSINLIEDSEKRHAGHLPLLFIFRSLVLAIPVIIVLFVVHTVITLNMNRAELIRIEEKIADKKPQLTLSSEIRKQERFYHDMWSQLNGWKAMRMDCSPTLETLRQTVPLEVQLTDMSLSRTQTTTNKTPVTRHTLLLKGKTGGTPEAHLTRFRLNLLREPGLTNTLADVVVPEGAFVEDTAPGALPMDRRFELNCRFLPREFK
ncbi:MAG: hypothetical protein R6X19_02905 [Kiritimatiellia bacterium]